MCFITWAKSVAVYSICSKSWIWQLRFLTLELLALNFSNNFSCFSIAVKCVMSVCNNLFSLDSDSGCHWTINLTICRTLFSMDSSWKSLGNQTIHWDNICTIFEAKMGWDSAWLNMWPNWSARLYTSEKSLLGVKKSL